MRNNFGRGGLASGVHNAETMDGYKYLVHGESKQKIKLLRPRYALYLNVTDENLLVTLDKIWRSDGPVLQSANSVHGDDCKDLCLAFSMSRFLRCRLEDVRLDADSLSMSRNLIVTRILHVDQNPARVFRIMELEISFLKDYFYTLYPIVFWQGLASLSLSVLQSLAALGLALWLASGVNRVKKDLPDPVNVVHGHNVEVTITWVFMSFMMFKEIWEMITYLLSDWTRLLLVCEYTRSRCRWIRNATMEKLLSSFLTLSSFLSRKIFSDPWHGYIDQYDFLQSFDYSPSLWNLMYRATLGVIKERVKGQKPGTAIKIPECVKPAILQALRSMDLAGLGGRELPRDVPSLSAARLLEDFRWALLDLYTCSQVILVWHIATSMCEIKLARDRGIDLSKPGLLRSAFTYLKIFLCGCCCTPQPYLVAENILGDDQLRTSYIVANSLSRYCAHLLGASDIMNDRDSLLTKYDKLNGLFSPEAAELKKLNGTIVEKGAVLGRQLLETIPDDQQRWQILAGVWADLLVHIAPSWNAEAHKICLEYGGELITFIWGLLWYCGIEKSSLWRDQDDAPGDANVQPQPQPAAEEPQGGHNVEDDAMVEDAQNGIEAREAGVQNQPAEQVLQQAAEADVEIADEAREDEPEPGNDIHAQSAADMEITDEAQEGESEPGSNVQTSAAGVEIIDEAQEEESEPGNNVHTPFSADVEIADQAQEEESESSNKAQSAAGVQIADEAHQ
ncbi:Os11g0617200 [Oryza sativa Japonica Group]|uniref:Os11g0617200 protein n=1 Tax=Oryza sativa subsp. japonica TaxID=39947 RepID=A0A0N7KT80_ORYSJ|nr:Os11g0617200 [Oryza sativa Japonica Group]